MAEALEDVRPVELDEIRAARARIGATIVRTPLVRLELGPEFPDIRLKLENLQPINAYKLRGAANAVAMLSPAERARACGPSAPATPARAWPTRRAQAGVPCTVVAIETAPASKLERMSALGAKLVLVSYADAWRAMEERAYPGVEGHLRASVRRSQFHRRPRHHGPGDSRGCSGHRARSSPALAAAG